MVNDVTPSTAHDTRWAWLRTHTPVLRDTVYMNCGWQGPLSDDVAAAMHDWIDRELTLGPTSRSLLDARIALGARYRERVAALLGADADEIAITDNTTHGLNFVTAGLPIAPGDGVVTTGVEHPSGIVPAYYLRERRGADLHIVPIAADDSPGAMIERFSAVCDARTRLVLISGVSFSTGQRLPLAEIVALAHRASPQARVLVDGAQTAGHEPLDVHSSGVDAYAIPMHKWLCGPGGLGALYVRRDRIAELEPAAVSGHAAASYDFAGNFTPERESIQKFELTTVSGPLLAGGVAAIDQYLASGPLAVWDRVRALTALAGERFTRIPGVTVTSARGDTTRSGLFAFHAQGLDAQLLAAHLQFAAHAVCRSVRELDSVRLSLHVYNTPAEIETVAQAVEGALAHGVAPEAADFVPNFARAVKET
ncbi:MAG: aminotransferase class V-fold PLP-dependent enzyme [Dehalococcoidia bacterium]|nr:aminotransferase class V-fold PLP-dependent enzyme [Dehalococcoidia bacterium]